MTIDPHGYGRGSGECEIDGTIDEGRVCSELDDWFMVEDAFPAGGGSIGLVRREVVLEAQTKISLSPFSVVQGLYS